MKLIARKDFTVSTVFLVIFTVLSLVISLWLTGGNFTYALDDPYIHMAIVKNLIQHGVWGVDGYSYASASSSPLWILILAPFYFLFGDTVFVYVPFLLNLVFQITSFYILFNIIYSFSAQSKQYLYAMILVVITPFIALTFGGMEHSLQLSLVLLLLYYFIEYARYGRTGDRNLLIFLAPFVVFVRYEDFALIFSLAFVMAFFLRQYITALSLLLSGLILVSLFALISKYMWGLDFLPSSILAKSALGQEFHLALFVKNLAMKFLQNIWLPHIFILYLFNSLVLYLSFSKDKILVYLTSVFLLTLMLHAAFGSFGWLYRYEAYLVIFGMMNIIIYTLTYHTVNKKLLVLSLLLLAFVKPIFGGLYQSIVGSKNIYEQQIQMSRLLASSFQGQSIAANDIGAISYFSQIKLLDIFGLGSNEIIDLKRKHQYNSETVNALLKRENVELMLIYDNWFRFLSFPSYVKIAEWKIKNNVILGGDTVSFYSRKDLVDQNRKKLEFFSSTQLPKNVAYTIMDNK